MSGYANVSALIDTGFLAEHLDDPAYTVVEVDEDTSAYDSGHIPGAVALNWQTELHDVPRRDFVSADRLTALLSVKGVNGSQNVVLYGGNSNWFAAYAYWLCMHRGVDNIRLLNGGRTKWELEGRPMTSEVPVRRPGDLTAGTARPELRAFRDEVIAMAAAQGATLVDVRSPAEFTGEVMAPPHLPQEQPYVPGHIPGARNIPWAQAANEDGTFKDADELRELYEGNGVSADGSVVVYCRIGERSSHTWFVLHELLGLRDVRNYDGSWTEYGSLVGVPVATGSG